MFEIIGFVGVIVLGLWMAFDGFWGWIALYGLSGNPRHGHLVIGVIGVILVCAAIYFSPFAIQFIKR